MAVEMQWVPVVTEDGRTRLEMRWRAVVPPAAVPVEAGATTGAEFAPAA